MSTLITLQAVYNSSTDLLKRFDLMPPTDVAWTKFLEEFTEATEALYDLQCRPRNEIFKSHAAMEICDCIVTLMNCLYVSQVNTEYINLDRELSALLDDVMTDVVDVRQCWILTHQQINSYFHRLQEFESQSLLVSRHAEQAGGVILIVKFLLRLGTLYKLTMDDFERSMESVIVKNGNKSHLTHEVRDGQIKKRTPVQETQS